MPYRSILVLTALLLLARGALAADPLATVRAFCRADADGYRLRARTWPRVAPLVDWQLEPAWDHVYLIQGYELSTPRSQGDGIVCDVKFTIVGEIPANRSRAAERVETQTFRLMPTESDQSWRIVGPPTAPHVFVDRVDREAMAELLDPEDGYVSAANLALRLLHDAGFDLPRLDIGSLYETALLENVEEPEPGDLVFYLDGGQPYHVGVMDTENRVVSATLNAAERRAPLDAFAGEIVYRRRASPDATPTVPAEATESPSSAENGNQ